uniref:Apolipoprotein A-IV n=1 Tax=Salvator merianae TaxID=96440 RepID=A0A8D0BGW5_SALMN
MIGGQQGVDSEGNIYASWKAPLVRRPLCPSRLRTMKSLIAALILASISGSQAHVLRETPLSPLEQFSQEVQEYLRNFTRLVDEKLDFIWKSQISQSVIDQLHNSYSSVSKRLRKLEDELPTEVKQGYDVVVGATLGTLEKGLSALRALQRQVTPATDKLAEDLYAIMSPYANTVLEKISRYTKALRRAIVNRAAKLDPQLNDKLKQQLEELQTQLAPYTKRFRNRLQEFERSLEPVAETAQEKFKQGAEEIKQALQPYLSSVLDRLQTYSQDLKNWVESPVFPPAP